jgi:hypothetical protein
MLAAILSILGIWGFGGVIWGIANNADAHNLRDYTKLSILIGGPIWWIFCFIDIVFGTLSKLNIKPKLKEKK